MGFGFGGLGGCCCDGGAGCEIFSDDFNRANNTDIGSDWTEVSGGWDINSNNLRCTSAGIAIANEVPTDAEVTVTVDANASSLSRRARAIIGYLDSSNYLYGEVLYFGSNSTVSVHRVVGGSDTTIDTSPAFTLNTGTTASLTVCLTQAGTLVAKIGATQIAAGAATALGTQVGVASNNSGVTFDGFIASYVSDECEECSAPSDCSNACCSLSDASLEYDVDLGAGGWTADDCSLCSSIQGVYTVKNFSPGQGFCTWQYQDVDWCGRTTACPTTGVGVCSDWDLIITLSVQTSGGTCFFRAEVDVRVTSTNLCTNDSTCNKWSRAVYESSTFATNAACNITSPLSLSKVSETHNGTTSPCDGSMPSTITIQSV